MPRPIQNPPNPYLSREVEWLGEPPPARVQVFEETARRFLNPNESPDVPFAWSGNPYRGCAHACAYCYARATHQYLGWGAGTDFESKLVIKRNAPELLAMELARRGWKREWILLSGNTDCYQPIEASYRLTRRCLEVARARANPTAIITKSALVARDVDLLADLARGPGARVIISLAFMDAGRARAIEPGAPTPARRLAALRILADAGIPCGVAFAPLIPGLNDAEIPAVLEAAHDAGAERAFMTLLRLPGAVREVFHERLAARLPLAARKVKNALADARQGQTGEHRFTERMQGRGPRWKLATDLFQLHCRRLGMDGDDWTSLRENPHAARQRQGELF